MAFLVSAHAEMSQISERRDLGEAELIIDFARRVATMDRRARLSSEEISRVRDALRARLMFV